MNDWLWNGEGEPDPDAERLKKALAPLAYRPPPGGEVSRFGVRAAAPRRRRAPLAAFAAAASIVLATGLALLAPAGSLPVTIGAASSQLFEGGRLVTAAEAARIDLPGIGAVDVEPGSEVRLVRAAIDEQHLALDRGAISARVLAPPRLFLVDTPAARAVDLGCAYRLSVDDEGRGRLDVTRGYVSLEAPPRAGAPPDVLVPAGFAAAIAAGGPRSPIAADAPAAFAAAVDRADVPAVLAAARWRDALTLWDLAWRTGGDARVVDRLLAFAPTALPREKLLALDREAMLAWRAAIVAPPSKGKR